jgi:hypothetical protein
VSKSIYRYCRAHAANHRRTVVRRYSEPPTPQPTPCRVWQGWVDANGYGVRNGQRLHRWVMEQVHGPIPEDMIVMHLCDNPPCFRYDHLRIGTTAENNADRSAKGRTSRAVKNPHWLHKTGEQHTQAKLTAEQVRQIRARLANRQKGYLLAEEYGVSTATISLIKNRHIWTDLA